MYLRSPSAGSHGGSTDGWVDLFCIEHCNLPLAGQDSLRASQTLLATAKPANRLIAGATTWESVSLQFTAPKDCAAVIFGPAHGATWDGGKSYGALLFDALNLQQGQGTCNDQGMCIPN